MSYSTFKDPVEKHEEYIVEISPEQDDIFLEMLEETGDYKRIHPTDTYTSSYRYKADNEKEFKSLLDDMECNDPTIINVYRDLNND